MPETDSKKGTMRWLVFDRTIVILHRKWRSKWWTVKCCGCSKWKRRKDGSCKHEREVLLRLRPDIAARTRVEYA